MGSLTGAVSSQRVNGGARRFANDGGHRQVSDNGISKLNMRDRTSRAGTKVGHSDPVVLNGRAIAQRIKGTPGITG